MREKLLIKTKSKPFVLLSPEGKIFECHGLRFWCKKLNLDRTNITKMLNGLKPHFKGWTGYYVDHQTSST